MEPSLDETSVVVATQRSEAPRPRRSLCIGVGVAVAYAVIGVLVRQATLDPSILPPLWPGAGLAFAAVVLWGNSGMAPVALS